MDDDLQVRLKGIKRILQQSLPDQKKIIRSFQQLSGLNLTILSVSTRKVLDDHLLKVNDILVRYDIKTFDDYDKVSDEHLKKLCRLIKQLYRKLLPVSA